jgi:pimeloyl-ACP methyl ester carboxylesterase
MTTLLVIVAVLAAGAAITLIGTLLIDRAHRPRGRFIEIGGFPQHVVDLNPPTMRSATPAVLLHGAGANLEDMNLALSERLAAGRRVVLVDRPGLGFSARKSGEGSSPAFQAAVLRDVLDRLGIKRAILVGHSWGGAMALTFALDFPERAAGLVLASPATHPSFYGLSKLNAVLATPFGVFFARTLALPFGALLIRPGSRTAFRPQPMPGRYIKRTAAMLVLRPPTLMANWADVGGLEPFLAQQAGRYGELSTPTIVFAGDRDFLAPPAKHAAKLAAAAPVVRLTVLPGFGHMLHHAAADRIAAAVDEIDNAPAHSFDSAT